MADKIQQWKVGDVISASKMNAMVDAINNLLSNETGGNDTVYITADELNNILKRYSDIGHTHSIDEIVDLIIPTKLSQLQNDVDYATEDYVTNAIANAQIGGDGEVDLSSYALKEDIPTKISELQNDSNFLISIPSEYVTETELNNKDFASKSYVSSEISKAQLSGGDGEVDLSSYALKEDIPTKISELQNDSNFLTSIPSEYVTEAELNNKDFASKSYVSSEIAKVQLEGGISELTEPTENDMPRLFLYDGVLPTTKNSVVMSFEYISKNKRFQGYVDIKCQGTSSMNYAKKNFTIKLFSDEALENKIKINFMNWGEQNKFCLKANWVDSTHTRNIVGARIGYDIVQSRPDSEFKRNLLTAPRCGLIDGFPIKLYYNGEFYGIYTWNIPKDAWQFAMDEDNENHIVLCAEKNSDGNIDVVTSCQFKTIWTNGDKGDWSVEVGTYSDSLVQKWNRVISFVKDSSDEEFINNFEQYFDLYSVIDYYCFSYFMAHIDGLAKNMLVATYDGNIWGCSLYDMDTTVGAYWNSTQYIPYNYKCPEHYQEQFSLLWERIEKCFTQILCERYFTLRKKELSLGNIINHIERLYDIIPDRVFNDEKEKWTNIPQVSTNTMTRARNYLRDRAEYVDGQFNKLMNGEDEPDTPDTPVTPDTPTVPSGYRKLIIDNTSELEIPGYGKNPSGENGQVLVNAVSPVSLTTGDYTINNYTRVDDLNNASYIGKGNLFAVTRWGNKDYITFTLDMNLGIKNTIPSIKEYLSLNPIYFIFKTSYLVVEPDATPSDLSTYAEIVLDGSLTYNIPGYGNNPSGVNYQVLCEYAIPVSSVPTYSFIDNYARISDSMNNTKYQGTSNIYSINSWDGKQYLVFTLDMDLGVENTVESITSYLSANPISFRYIL